MTITPNALFHADCIGMMQRMEPESIDLVYLDPPVPLSSSECESGLSRDIDDYSYQQLQLISRACQETHRVMKPTGVLFFHAHPSSAFTIRLILNQVFGEGHFRSEIVWQFQRGPSSRAGRSGNLPGWVLRELR